MGFDVEFVCRTVGDATQYYADVSVLVVMDVGEEEEAGMDDSTLVLHLVFLEREIGAFFKIPT